MEIINYITDNFVMTVECRHIERLYQKASIRIINIESSTQYLITGATGIFRIWSEKQKKLSKVKEFEDAHPVFFENTDYYFDITFMEAVKNPRIYSRLKEITEKFNCRQRTIEQTLTGSINFGNDIGSCEFILLYEKDGVPQKWILRFEVFPTKLDFRNDHQIIVKEVEEEYSKLALDLLKRTFSNFRHVRKEGNDLTWWTIFGGVFLELIQAMQFILNKPHSRLVSKHEFVKKEKLKRLNPGLEEALMRYQKNPGKLYKITRKSLSYDTTENRFLKHVAIYAYQKFNSIWHYIEKHKAKVISKGFWEELGDIDWQLMSVLSHPFFKATGDFGGMSQESTVLQKKAGYSTVYRNWILLRRSVQLFEGIKKIELKNIADLYQFWCFLKIKNIIQSLLDKEPSSIDLVHVQRDNFLFALKRGTASRVVFDIDNGGKIELYHDLSYDRKDSNSHMNCVFTEVQRPDITLKITKNDLHEFTYLFDVKYQIDSDRSKKGCDSPPVDAINQIHRYRDAIYHYDSQTETTSRAVIGCYILFPGSGSVETVRESSYFTSIAAINIGGFPLLPNDQYQSTVLLREHLQKIIESDSDSLLKKIIPQKGLQYKDR